MKILAPALLMIFSFTAHYGEAAVDSSKDRFEYASPDETVSTVRSSVTRCMRRSMSKMGFLPIQISGDSCNPDPKRTERMARPEGEIDSEGMPFKKRAF